MWLLLLHFPRCCLNTEQGRYINTSAQPPQAQGRSLQDHPWKQHSHANAPDVAEERGQKAFSLYQTSPTNPTLPSRLHPVPLLSAAVLVANTTALAKAAQASCHGVGDYYPKSLSHFVRARSPACSKRNQLTHQNSSSHDFNTKKKTQFSSQTSPKSWYRAPCLSRSPPALLLSGAELISQPLPAGRTKHSPPPKEPHQPHLVCDHPEQPKQTKGGAAANSRAGKSLFYPSFCSITLQIWVPSAPFPIDSAASWALSCNVAACHFSSRYSNLKTPKTELGLCRRQLKGPLPTGTAADHLGKQLTHQTPELGQGIPNGPRLGSAPTPPGFHGTEHNAMGQEENTHLETPALVHAHTHTHTAALEHLGRTLCSH